MLQDIIACKCSSMVLLLLCLSSLLLQPWVIDCLCVRPFVSTLQSFRKNIQKYHLSSYVTVICLSLYALFDRWWTREALGMREEGVKAQMRCDRDPGTDGVIASYVSCPTQPLEWPCFRFSNEWINVSVAIYGSCKLKRVSEELSTSLNSAKGIAKGHDWQVFYAITLIFGGWSCFGGPHRFFLNVNFLDPVLR